MELKITPINHFARWCERRVDSMSRWWWEKRHPKEHAQQIRFFEAMWQVSQEDLLDPLPLPIDHPFAKIPMIGGIMGKRYFKRLEEILEEKERGH